MTNTDIKKKNINYYIINSTATNKIPPVLVINPFTTIININVSSNSCF